jgi:hypothetical protein
MRKSEIRALKRRLGVDQKEGLFVIHRNGQWQEVFGDTVYTAEDLAAAEADGRGVVLIYPASEYVT